ncbi:protein-glutamine gamma-glutamyltransferase [Shouchella lonarensis]|uniref:Protein-glutamine gamma-glutamyltransferase n=1 Tax=Shouchella lonarensis TaxID=1464122 RepID=A0A1G6LLJ6_9BACI|nr:protein-glutamine gamma-glutamyltransferase [Shouchella lonarensis]SDC44182.1 protein-glutamine gamma-glutamyltransferase [Shouchella lonarensis]
MIEIAGKPVKTTPPQLSLSSHEKAILQSLMSTHVTYQYDSLAQLSFEIALRRNIVAASYLMMNSGAGFTAFAYSRCNPYFFRRLANGGFLLHPHVNAADAIDDIFRNGHAYDFECATAIIILFYKAVLDSIDRASFNRLFRNLYLYSWEHDAALNLVTTKGTDFVIGDCVYFNNPDFDPNNDVWRGENTIKLEWDLYFGHGIATKTAAQVIAHLNSQRRPGATRSAYLLAQVTRLNFTFVRTFSETGYTPRTGLDQLVVRTDKQHVHLY